MCTPKVAIRQINTSENIIKFESMPVRMRILDNPAACVPKPIVRHPIFPKNIDINRYYKSWGST